MNIKISKYISITAVFLVFAFLVGGLLGFPKTHALTPEPASAIQAANRVKLHLFYTDTCPHCKAEKVFLSKMAQIYPITLELHEITTSKENMDLFINVAESFGDKSGRVPFLVIGKEYVLGYLNDETQGVQIENLIKKYIANGVSVDAVEDVKKQINWCETEKSKTQPDSGNEPMNQVVLDIPFIGKVNINTFTLPLLTAAIGLTDGFNPCAMWALLFLISLLLGTQNKFKMWLLGGVFILTSGAIYFLFMTAWLNLFLIIGYATHVRTLIGLLALGFGVYYLWDFYKKRQTGCLVEGNEKRERIFTRLKQLVQDKRILVAVGGMIALAFAVNLVEMLCSAGLPAIYTKTLTMASLPTWKYYLYLLVYIFFYMLDDMVIFIITMATLEMTGVKKKYSQYAHLVGGIVILLIGIVMLVKPELLMFN